jgi:pimeloyl-ACP methyl ester carboxylesterase
MLLNKFYTNQFYIQEYEKNIVLLTLNLFTMTTIFLQTARADQNLHPAAGTTYKTIKTQSVDVGGTRFMYRKLGKDTGIPVICLNHLAAVLDYFDPAIIDGLATQHTVITFDNRGVGASGGSTPKTVAAMAKDAIAFIHALGYEKVNLFGFSLGGFISQEILRQEPQLVHKVILAGTGPAGGVGIDKVTGIAYRDVIKATLTFRDPRFYLFFTKTHNGKQAARQFIKRTKERAKNDRDKKLSIKTFNAQLKAIHAWGLQAPQDLSIIKQPVLVVNGESDKMVPSINSFYLAQRLPNSQIVIYKDAGHGGHFQYHEEFVKKVLEFLQD